MTTKQRMPTQRGTNKIRKIQTPYKKNNTEITDVFQMVYSPYIPKQNTVQCSAHLVWRTTPKNLS